MIIVQKFGGTSVGSIERIKASAEIVKQKILSGKKVVVIVSAMAGETDKLISLFNQVSEGNFKNRSEMDAILSTGEMMCAGLFAARLNATGIKARSFNAMQAGILTDETYSNAKITGLALSSVLTALEEGFTPIIAGFQGYSIKEGRLTTLGRGGSDTSAIAIAAALNAEKCEIYKDVEGVLTGDPKIIENPKKIDEISHNSMLEISSSGAKILEVRSVNFAAKYNLSTEILSSFNQVLGTKMYKMVDEKAVIQNLSLSINEVLACIKVENSKEIISKIPHHFSKILSVEKNENGFLVKFLIKKQEISKLSGAEHLIQNVSIISIIGLFLKSDEIFEKSVEILNQLDAKFIYSTISETKIMFFFVEEDKAKNAINKLHEAFL